MALIDRGTKRAFEPRMRIVIEVERASFALDGSRVGGELLILDGDSVSDATTTMSIQRPSTAQFSIANPHDKWFNSARKLATVTRRQKEVGEYLLEVIKQSKIKERNKERRSDFWERVRAGRLSPRAGKYLFENDNGQTVSVPPPQSREEEYAQFEFFSREFALMNRVWIDFTDRNGDFVAGFSGLISTVQKHRTAGQIGTASISCKSLLSMMQRSEIVITAGLDQSFEPCGLEVLSKIDMTPQTNALAGLNGIEILERAINRTQDIYCFNSGRTEEKESKIYFYQDKFWQMAANPPNTTVGDIYPIGLAGFLGPLAPAANRLSDNVGYGLNDVAVNPHRDINANTVTPELNGKFIIDPEIVANDRGQFDIFRKVLRQGFKVYQNTLQFAYTICREVADTIGYDFYDDPKGNIVFQAPKYDKLPRLRGDQGIDERDMAISSPVAFGTSLGLDVGLPGSSGSRFGEDYSDIPYHGPNYILDAIGDKSLRTIDTEDSLYTYVTATGNAHYFQSEDETISRLTKFGSTAPAQLTQEIGQEYGNRILRLCRRYGVRRHNLRALVTGMIATNFLTRYAYMNLVQLNAGKVTGTIAFHQRPDIWPGRSVLLAEEQKLGYVVATTNTFNKSAQSPHQTSLTLAYVHHPNDRIGIPWLIATDIPQTELEEIEKDLLWEDVPERL